MADEALLSIGELARRVGLPVRTIRFWSDTGMVPPAARTGSGRRLYDAACVARLELVATLRELGVGLADVRRVLDEQASLAEVAAVHLDAVEAQIRSLQLHRAMLAAVAKRAAADEEMTVVNKLARSPGKRYGGPAAGLPAGVRRGRPAGGPHPDAHRERAAGRGNRPADGGRRSQDRTILAAHGRDQPVACVPFLPARVRMADRRAPRPRVNCRSALVASGR
jgi:DNA-binding transcriptional MerR regulator